MEPVGDNCYELTVIVRFECNASEPKATLHPVHEDSFRKIHGVGHGDDDEARVRLVWPVKEAVEHLLLFGDQQVQFIHQHDAALL